MGKYQTELFLFSEHQNILHEISLIISKSYGWIWKAKIGFFLLFVIIKKNQLLFIVDCTSIDKVLKFYLEMILWKRKNNLNKFINNMVCFFESKDMKKGDLFYELILLIVNESTLFRKITIKQISRKFLANKFNNLLNCTFE